VRDAFYEDVGEKKTSRVRERGERVREEENGGSE
jgi:hypothetical protein